MFLNMSTSVSINSTSAPQKQNSKLDSETINHLWLQIKNLVKLQFTSIAPHIRFKIFLLNALIKLAMIARKLINYLLQRKLIGVPNYSRYHLMVLTKDRTILLMTNITLLGVFLR